MKPAICTSFDLHYAMPFAQVIAMIREAGFEVVPVGSKNKAKITGGH